MEGITLWPAGGLIGYKRIWEEGVKDKDGKAAPSYVEGAILALRENGNYALFACSVEGSKTPAEWIPIGDFIPNPIAVATEEDFFEDEPLAEGIDVEAADREPMDPRHRGAGINPRDVIDVEEPKRPGGGALKVLRRGGEEKP